MLGKFTHIQPNFYKYLCKYELNENGEENGNLYALGIINVYTLYIRFIQFLVYEGVSGLERNTIESTGNTHQEKVLSMSTTTYSSLITVLL